MIGVQSTQHLKTVKSGTYDATTVATKESSKANILAVISLNTVKNLSDKRKAVRATDTYSNATEAERDKQDQNLITETETGEYKQLKTK